MPIPTEAGAFCWREDGDAEWEIVRTYFADKPPMVGHLRAVLPGSPRLHIDVGSVHGEWGPRILDSAHLAALQAVAAATVGRCHARGAAEKWRFMAEELTKLHPTCQFGPMCRATATAVNELAPWYTEADFPWLKEPPDADS